MNLNTFEMDKHEQGHEMIHQLEQDVDTINREVGEDRRHDRRERERDA